MNTDEFLRVMHGIFGGQPWPRAVRFVYGLWLIAQKKPLPEAAAAVGTTTRKLNEILQSADPIASAIGGGLPATEDEKNKAARRTHQALGQMLLGRCAERAFETLYKEQMQNDELQLENVTAGGTDTDYRLLNGQGRKLYRINIKYFGSLFKNARQWVNLDPEDCFPLATYKIKSAREKQREEGKPYFFAIVGIPGLTAQAAGKELPNDIVQVATVVLSSNAERKREFEDSIVDYAERTPLKAFTDIVERLKTSDWYILSAQRADRLLHERLYDRVPAIFVRNFTRQFAGAEVDMHFSLGTDLTPLTRLFEMIKVDGREKVSTLLERGDL